MLERIVLVRHGQAQLRGLVADSARALTYKGAEVLQRSYPDIFAPLRDEASSLTVWSSEALRTMQTAEAVCEALGVDQGRIEVLRSLTSQDAGGFLDDLAKASGTVVAVGHDPMVSEVASSLTHRMRQMLRGQVMCIDVEGGSVGRTRFAWTKVPR